MNIFVLDTDPKLAALYHNDRHVVKMILETTQLLSTAHHMLDGAELAVKNIGMAPLWPTHVNHPCAKWARENSANYLWLYSLGVALLDEYTLRYGKMHSYELLLRLKLKTLPRNIERVDAKMTPWPQCMPDRFRHRDTVTAYRQYYFGAKKHIASWRAPAAKPSWWKRFEKQTTTSTL